MAYKKYKKRDYRQEITDKFIDALKKGTAPWQKPWEKGRIAEIPHNPVTGTYYKGINLMFLSMASDPDPRFMTFKQAKEKGYSIKKGSVGFAVEYWKFRDKKLVRDNKGEPVLDEDGEKQYEVIEYDPPMVKRSTVFNGLQIKGIEPYKAPEISFDPDEKAEEVIKQSNIKVEFLNRDQACYLSMNDEVQMPPMTAFPNKKGYYSTILHELGHATGHKSRLGRKLGNVFGSKDYAKEELRAEIASYMIARELGIEHEPNNHASYVASWIKALEDDKNEIYNACKDAETIKNWLLYPEKRLDLEKKANKNKEISNFAPEVSLEHQINNIDDIFKPTKEELKRFTNDFNSFIRGELKSSKSLVIGETPFIYQELSFTNKPLSIAQSIVTKVCVKSHEIDTSTMLKLPELLNDPIMILKSRDKKKPNSYVVVLNDVDRKNTNIIAIVSNVKGRYNVIPSIYGKNNIKNFIKEDIEKGRLLYLDKEKALELSKHIGLQLPKGDKLKSYNSNILFKDDIVNRFQQKSKSNITLNQESKAMVDRVYLHVPFEEKEKAKKLGARWHKSKKAWYVVKDQVNLDDFKSWLKPQKQKIEENKLSPVDDLAKFLKENGFELKGSPIIDGKFHRCKVIQDVKKGKQSGSYIAFSNGIPNATVKNFKTGEDLKWVYTKHELTSQNREELEKQFEENKRKHQKELEEARKKAAKKAFGIFTNMKEEATRQNCPYLAKKGVDGHGVKVNKSGGMVIPIRDEKGYLWGIQNVNENYKNYLEDAKKQGCMHIIDNEAEKLTDIKSKNIIVVEGYATGASIYEATKEPVVICFDSNNLKDVVTKVRNNHQEANIIIAADNDHPQEKNPHVMKNPGIEKAKEAAIGNDVKIVIPEFNESEKEQDLTDFNDFAKSRGNEALKIEISKYLVKKLEKKKSREKFLNRAI